MEEDYKNQRQKDREKIMTLKANYEDFVSIFMVLTVKTILRVDS